jgi:Na+-driven multidrug efflux pump
MVILMIPLMIFAPSIVKLLNSTPEVIESGTMYLRLLSPFYILCCFNQIYACALRGAGNSRASMVIMLLSFVGFRQLYLFIMSLVCYKVVPIALGYPAGWLACCIATVIYYHRTKLDKTRLVA